MTRLLLPLALALGWAAALAAADPCPVSMTKLGPTTKRGSVRRVAGGKVKIMAEVRTTQAVDDAIVALYLPADFQLLKSWSTLKKGPASAPIVNGQVRWGCGGDEWAGPAQSFDGSFRSLPHRPFHVNPPSQNVYWRNVTLVPGKKPAKFRLTAKIPKCYPTSAVSVLGATYQIDAENTPSCLVNAQPAPIQIKGAKRTKPSDASTCSGAGAVSCPPGFFASEVDGTCEACGINKVCAGGAQPAPALVDCPLGTGTVTGATAAYDPGLCVVLPCDPCGAQEPDLYLSSGLSVYKQPAWNTNVTYDQNTAELQCTLDSTDPFLCSLAPPSCTLNDIAIDNQGCVLRQYMQWMTEVMDKKC